MNNMLSLISSTQYSDNYNLLKEKKNLINIFKLVIKDLIDTSLNNDNTDRIIDTDSNELRNFFIILENIFSHGLKTRRTFSLSASFKKDLTYLIDLVQLKLPESNDLVKSIRDMNEIKTPLGKLRAFLRLSLMQKKLSDYFDVIIKNGELIQDLYENESILLTDESSVISGLLVGLNVIDYNFYFKLNNDDFDKNLQIIDYSIYLRERLPTINVSSNEQNNQENLESNNKTNAILDQNSYLEELNKRYQLQIEQLQTKLTAVEKSNVDLSSELVLSKNEIIELSQQLEQIKTDKEKIEKDFKQRLESTMNDIHKERETFQSSKAGLDNLYLTLQTKLQDEIKLRKDIERELEAEKIMKSELQSAIKIMEKGLIEKQDLLDNLRDQLEQVKNINLEKISIANNAEQLLKIKIKELDDAFNINRDLNKKISDLETKIDNLNNLKFTVDKQCDKLLEKILGYEKKIGDLQTELENEKSLKIKYQTELEIENNRLQILNNKNASLLKFKEEHDKLLEENSNLKVRLVEQEKTLEEIGSQLEHSRLKMEDFKEANQQIHEFEWEKDENVHICKLCNKDFNVARRKHHCRRCGGIYCNECSDNKMPLPSSSKPVRVCDICRDTIIKQCTSK